MDRILFLLPYNLAAAISLGVLIYTWQHRHIRGAGSYVWYVAGQTLWIVGYIFELTSPELDEKIFWDQFQWVTGLTSIIAFPVFAIQFSESKLRFPRLFFGLSLVFPLSFLVILATDSQHHLLYPNPTLEHTHFLGDLKYDFTWVVYAYAFYAYLVSFAGLWFLLKRLVRPHNLYRSQIAMVVIGFLIPTIVTMFTLAGVEFKPYRDVTPFTFAIGNLVIAWGLFRYRLFDILPIARDLVFEEMDDFVIVLDTKGRVIDANRNALAILQMEAHQVIGQPGRKVFTSWPELIRQFQHPSTSHTNVAVVAYEQHLQYEVRSTMLYDKHKHYIGRVFVARNITDHIELQNNLVKLNNELQESVSRRTEELRKSGARYRAVVEHQTEFIVRWKGNGIRTFVNDAYCDHFGIASNEAIGTSFLPLVAEEDRQAIEGKISRLLSGEVDVVTEVHQVVNADGSIGWQEWTDQAIHDESGNIIEFQSIGRDVTERIQADQALLASEERLRAVVDEAPFGALYYELKSDERLIFIGANPAADQILAVNAQQYVGKTIEEAFPPLADTEIPDAYRRVITSGERFSTDQVDYEDDEIQGVFEVHAFKTGERRLAVFFRDITERKRAEDALRESEERFSMLSEAAFEGIGFSDEGRVIDCNEQLATMLGYSQSEMIGLEVSKFVAPESFEIVSKQIISGYEGPYEHLALSKDGTKFPVEVRGKTIPYKGRQIRVTIIRDITERKQAEARLTQAYDTTLEGWAKALEMRDKETEDHSQRVVQLTISLAEAYGIQGEELTNIRYGAILHDIGKMGIPDGILRKPGKLTRRERRIMKEHPNHSFKLLSEIPFLQKSVDIPYCHHERWDGGGYPRGLKGEEIPLAARIFSVVDVWDAICSDRPYSNAWPKEKAINYLKSESGKQFDPQVVDVFLEIIESGKI